MKSIRSKHLNRSSRGTTIFTTVLFAVAFAGWNAPKLVLKNAFPNDSGLFAQSAEENKTAAIMRGRRIFEKRCVMCHGATGKGDGIRAMSLAVRPANLSISKMSEAEQARIIERGGAAVGRSPLMPVWGSEFSRTEIQNLVKYLQAINITRN